jgi:hypothetical protein
MIQRFASASAVATVLIALAAGSFRLSSIQNMEGRYLLTTVWCMVPLAWGLWAMLIPKSLLPHRLPLWGAILGLIGGIIGVFVLDLPLQVLGKAVPVGQKAVIVLLFIGIYYLLWFLVRRVQQALAAPSPTA